MIANVISFLKNDQGAEIAEYAVAAALVVAIAVVVYEAIGQAIFDANTATGEKIKADPGFEPK